MSIQDIAVSILELVPSETAIFTLLLWHIYLAFTSLFLVFQLGLISAKKYEAKRRHLAS